MHQKKGEFCLRWLCDIAETLRFYEKEINWEYLLQSSKNYRIKNPVYQEWLDNQGSIAELKDVIKETYKNAKEDLK